MNLIIDHNILQIIWMYLQYNCVSMFDSFVHSNKSLLCVDCDCIICKIYSVFVCCVSIVVLCLCVCSSLVYYNIVLFIYLICFCRSFIFIFLLVMLFMSMIHFHFLMHRGGVQLCAA